MAEQVDEYFTAAVAALPASAQTGVLASTTRSSRDRRCRCGRPWTSSTPSSPAATSTSPRAGCAAAGGLLHDRLVRARGQRRGRRGAAARPTRRCCTTAPAASTAPGPRQVAGPTPVARRAARRRRRGRGADRRRPAQGLRPPRPGTSSRRPRRSPRTCPARSGWPSRSSAAAQLGVPRAVARRTRSWCAASATRRSTTPRAAGALNTAVLRRLPGPADAAAVRLRGQRPRHQRPHPARLGRGGASRPGPGCATSRADGCDLRRRLRRAPRGGRVRPRAPPAGRAAPAARSG